MLRLAEDTGLRRRKRRVRGLHPPVHRPPDEKAGRDWGCEMKLSKLSRDWKGAIAALVAIAAYVSYRLLISPV
jgi:hypothetical protein